MLIDKYRVLEELGNGAFSKIYLGRNVRNDESVIIKTEDAEGEIGLLKHEASMYMRLMNVNGLLLLKWYGVVDDLRCLVLPYGGLPLSSMDGLAQPVAMDYFRQIVDILSSVHQMGVVHRDLKPDNILVNEEGQCKVIDLGLSSMFLEVYGNHVPERKIQSIVGSPAYVSLNVHELCNPTRRDDLESACYVYLYMVGKGVPWHKCPLNEVVVLKRQMRNYAPAFLFPIWEYVRKLSYDETPDYESLVSIIEEEVLDLGT